MNTVTSAAITISRMNMHPSVFWVDLEEEYDPFLKQKRTRKDQGRVHFKRKDEG
jgi:hypothetical protein